MNKYMILIALVFAVPTVNAGGGSAVGFGLGGLGLGLALSRSREAAPRETIIYRQTPSARHVSYETDQEGSSVEVAAELRKQNQLLMKQNMMLQKQATD